MDQTNVTETMTLTEADLGGTVGICGTTAILACNYFMPPTHIQELGRSYERIAGLISDCA